MTENELEQDFVTKKDFDNFKSDLLEIVRGNATPAPAPTRVFSVTSAPTPVAIQTPQSASAEASNYTLNPAYQAIFEEYFDPADGFEARLEYPYFTIFVPEKFSNADPAWRKYYKVDSRLKFLKHDNIEGGMRDWCKLVAANLKYDKNIKTK